MVEIELKEKFDLLFKFIIIGDTSVGKSCILHHYLRNKCKSNSPNKLSLSQHAKYCLNSLMGEEGNRIYMICKYLKSCLVNNNSKHTVGVEFGMRYLKVNNQVIKIQIWDTAGQERYRSVTRGYFRGSLGVIIVYDITRYI